MELNINGKKVTTKNNDIFSLVAELSLNLEGLVVLHNDNIIKKDHYKEIILLENDKVELLNFVSGG